MEDGSVDVEREALVGRRNAKLMKQGRAWSWPLYEMEQLLE